MNFKRSMISAATAAVLVAGFTGCGNSDDTTTSNDTTNNSGIVTQIATPTGTVTGTVMDTNGNTIEGVNVYLAGQTAVTDAGGVYKFDDVPVTTTSTDGANNANAANQTLSVTIAAPAGYLGATVTVTPTAQLDHTNDDQVLAGGDTLANDNATFIDGYIASAGTAVLPAIGATVTGKLELASAETAIANQEVTLDFLNASNATGANIYAQNGVITTYATGSYTATTDANGMFTFTNVPADSDLTYIVPNFTVVGEQTAQGTNAVTVTTDGETSVTNVGDLQVNAVVNNDVTAPYVVSTVGEIGNAAARQMLEDDVRETIVINFSEAMVIETDKDFTSSVIVKAGATLATMTDRTATATATATGLTVVLDTPLLDNEFLDINLLISDFKDTAGNFLGLFTVGTTNVAYDSIPGAGQVVKLAYQGYNDLNTEAPSVVTLSQNTVDANGATNDAATLQAMNNAFNDVIDSNTPDNSIAQMNALESAPRLVALGNSALSVATVAVTADVARITFTPSGAAAYNVKATRTGSDINLPLVAVQNGATVATVAAGTANANGTTTDLITPASASDVTPMEFVIPTGVVAIGDVITITPVDDLGYVGTATTITLVDNVAPTTILQKSYGLGNTSNGNSTVVKFGDGGELSDTSGTVTVGTPYLAITAGLLDNQKADGTAVNGLTVSDNALTTELYASNTINTTLATPAAYIASATGIYDTTAWATFNTDAKLARTVGVAFSENINLNGTTPSTTGVSSTLSAWTANNDVLVNDDTGVVASDLVDFTTNNVLTLANTDTLGVIDFTGIQDAATTPNVTTAASNAKVVVLDKMPPFVTQASFDGTSVIITFNEPMKALAAGETISITSAVPATRTATYAVANDSKYVFSADKMTLTIASTEFAGLTKTDFDIGAAYVESAYGTVARTHAALTWTTADALGNDWAAENAGVIAPKFAIAELIGEFTHLTSASGFLVAENTTTNSQKVVWTFAHPIKNDAAGEILNGVVVNASGNYVWDGSVGADLANIQAWFETTTGAGGAAEVITQVAGAESTSLSLDSTKKILTLTFTTTTDADATSDAVRMIAAQVITSATDNTQTVNGNSLIANAQ